MLFLYTKNPKGNMDNIVGTVKYDMIECFWCQAKQDERWFKL